MVEIMSQPSSGHRVRFRAAVAAVSSVVLWSLLAVPATSGAQTSTEDSESSSSYGDVANHWAAEQISALEASGVLAGTECGEAMFCPDADLRREIMAVWIVRVLDGADPEPVNGTRFSDVDDNHPWAAHIERLAELEVTRGHIDGTYRPDDAVTRAQLASFLVRAFDLPAVADDYSAGFEDTDGEDINRLAAAGLTNGCGDGNFCPERATSRAEVAVFLVRAMKWRAAQAEAGSQQQPGAADLSGSTGTTPVGTSSAPSRAAPSNTGQASTDSRNGGTDNGDADTSIAPCADGTPGTAGTDSTLTGTVSYANDIDLTSNSTLTVRLQDVSLADSPALVVADQVISNPGPGPVSFSIDYRACDIVENHRYSAAADIYKSGSLVFVNDTTYDVLGRDATPGPVNIPLTRVSS